MALPVDILLGVYLGLLTGVLPAVVAYSLGFVFRYVTGVTVPGLAVVALGVAIAGVNGGLLGLYDEAVRNSPILLTAVLVVLMMTLYAHNRGDKLGATLPRRFTLRSLRSRTLSADVVELVGGRGQVHVTTTGEVGDLEGYPPLSEALRERIAEWSDRFPADLPFHELERRVEDRLKSEFDLADVTVALDERARATVEAAPPASGLSKRVPEGKRAVSVNALVPTGLARRDEVTLFAPDLEVSGVVLSARSDRPGPTPKSDGGVQTDGGSRTDGGPRMDGGPRTDGGEDDPPKPVVSRAPTTTGGEGRITVAVDRSDAPRLLAVESARVVVGSRGTRREYELVSLLRQAGNRFQRLTVREGGPLDGVSLGEAAVRETYGVAVLAIRHGEVDVTRDWQVAPRGDTLVHAGDELYVTGVRAAIDELQAVTV